MFVAVAHDASGEVLRSKRLGPPRRWLATFSDERLVERLARGEGLAFEVLYDRYHRPLLGFCRHMLRSHEEAEDALQHVFMSAHRAIADGGDRPARVRPWLYTVARNRCLSMMRSKRDHVQPLADDAEVPAPGPSRTAEERADLRAILSDVRALPEAQRTALVLAELGGLSHPEVSEVLDCDQAKVKSLVFQGRAKLLQEREARETPCSEVREEVATMTGSRLRGRARRHVKSCAPCAGFAADMRRQRQLLALALPVAPSLGLKRSVLGATLGGGGGGAGGGGLAAGAAIKAGAAGAGGAGGVASGGATAATGVVAAITAHAGVTKAAAVALAAGGVATGVTAGDAEREMGRTPDAPAAQERHVDMTPGLASGDSESGWEAEVGASQEENVVRTAEEGGEPGRAAPPPPPPGGDPPEHAAPEGNHASPPTSAGPPPSSPPRGARAETQEDSRSSRGRPPPSEEPSDQAEPARRTRGPAGPSSGEAARVAVARPSIPRPPARASRTPERTLENDVAPVPSTR